VAASGGGAPLLPSSSLASMATAAGLSSGLLSVGLQGQRSGGRQQWVGWSG
jgi:hypothetical protein